MTREGAAMKLELAKRPRFLLPIIAVLLASALVGAASGEEARRPRVGEDRNTAPAPAEGPAFELAGLAKLDGDASFALLQEPELTMGAPVLVRLGQSIGPYRLVAVEEDRVMLEGSTGLVTVLLGSKGNAGPPAGAPPTRSEPHAVVGAPSSPASAVTGEEPVGGPVKGSEAERLLNTLKKAFGGGTRP